MRTTKVVGDTFTLCPSCARAGSARSVPGPEGAKAWSHLYEGK